MKLRGYVYGLFPVEIEEGSIEMKAVDNSFIWKYFEWLFYFIREIISFLCDILHIEPLFPVYFVRKVIN